ncbi:MAG: hypothetical protein IPN22_06495 [Bacteroidetes bacterium]|nr:hypothetical protein [Bacteroidota bacterium]
MKHTVVQQRDEVTSKQARLITFDLLTNYYRLTNQYKQLVAISKKELVHYTPALLKDPYYAYRYIFMLHNLIGTLPHSAERKKYYTLLERAPTPNETTLHYKRLFLLHKAQGEAARMSEQDFSKLYAQTDAELKHSWLQQKAQGAHESFV